MCNDWILNVREFNKAFNIEAPTRDLIAVRLQEELIYEETDELRNALRDFYSGGAATEVLDAIADSVYVLIGLSEKLGFDLTKAFAEVHLSNMSKLGEDGKPIYRKDGKILKGTRYFKPDLAAYLPRKD